MEETTNRLTKTSTILSTVTTASTSGGSVQASNSEQTTTNARINEQPSSNSAIVTIPPADTTNDTRVLHSSSGTWLCCVPCYWLNHNNSVHKASLTIATLVVTSLLVASPVLFLISSVPGGEVIRDCFPQVNKGVDNLLFYQEVKCHSSSITCIPI